MEISIEQKILNWKNKIESDTVDKSRLEGEEVSINRRMKDEFNCENLDEAQKKIISLDESLIKLKQQLDKKVAEYDQLYTKS